MIDATDSIAAGLPARADLPATAYHPSMLASGWFWGCGLISVGLWSALFWVMFA